MNSAGTICKCSYKKKSKKIIHVAFSFIITFYSYSYQNHILVKSTN